MEKRGVLARDSDHSPDSRGVRIGDALRASPAFRAAIHDVLAVPDDAPLNLDALLPALTQAGVPTLSIRQQNDWIDRIVRELDQQRPGRYVVVQAGSGDRLTSLLDDQQRERVQMHDKPLALRVVEPDAAGHFPVAEFARSADGIGKHVWLTWLDPGFLRRQFEVNTQLDDTPTLGLLSCDRTHGDPHASWLPFSNIPPGLAARALGSGDTVALLLTSLRTLEATSPYVSFRGFEPAFVLIDSDLVAFLQRSVEGGQLAWSVIGSTGGRTVDILVFERVAAPGVIYTYVCTAPTGHLTAAWLNRCSESCLRDDERFKAVATRAWALIEHLLGTFWIFDLYGWPAAPVTPIQT